MAVAAGLVLVACGGSDDPPPPPPVVNTNVAPAVTTQPAGATVQAPATATFTVAGSGTPTPTVQWQRSDNGGSTWVDIAGATSLSYFTAATAVVADNGSQYRAVFSNSQGTATSQAAALTVNAAPVVTVGSINLVVGTIDSRGYADGTGNVVRFNSPVALAVDAAGNAYVREPCLIRKVTPAGVVSTLAGVVQDCNIADGPPGTGRVGGGSSLAADAAGNVYFTDGLGAIRKATPGGVLSTVAGDSVAVGFVDGQGVAARFQNPNGIAVDSAGNLYVADTGNFAVRKITPSGVVSTVATGTRPNSATSVVDGPLGVATFGGLNRIAVDAAGAIYLSDSVTNSVRKIAGGVVSTLAGDTAVNGSAGAADGVGTAARFNTPEQLVVDATGNVYVADLANSSVRKITPDGTVSTVLGALGDPRMLPNANPPRIVTPTGLAMTSTGQLWLTSIATYVVMRATVP